MNTSIFTVPLKNKSESLEFTLTPSPPPHTVKCKRKSYLSTWAQDGPRTLATPFLPHIFAQGRWHLRILSFLNSESKVGKYVSHPFPTRPVHQTKGISDFISFEIRNKSWKESQQPPLQVAMLDL